MKHILSLVPTNYILNKHESDILTHFAEWKIYALGSKIETILISWKDLTNPLITLFREWPAIYGGGTGVLGFIWDIKKKFPRCIITEFERKVDVQNHEFWWEHISEKKFVNISMLESIISFSLFYWISYFLWICSQNSTNS